MTNKLPEKGSQAYYDLCQRIANGEDYRSLAVELNVSWDHIRHRFPRKLAETELKTKPKKTSVDIELPSGLTPDETIVLKMLPSSVGSISRKLDRSRETVVKIIDSLRSKHYQVELNEASREVRVPLEATKDFEPTGFTYFKHYYKVGIVTDTHCGSRYQQMTLLYDAYAEFDKRDVDFVLHAGDLNDGIDMYKGHREELFLYDAGQQLRYAEANYPKCKNGAKTYVIGGQHDFSFYKQNGYNILEHLCVLRDDLVFKGFFKAQFSIKGKEGMQILMMHPGGGVSYARSYRPQRIIENLIGFFMSASGSDVTQLKPHACFMGHWHIPCHLPSYMGIEAVTLSCFQSQTPYLAQKGLMPVVGYAVGTFTFDDNFNLTGISLDFINQNSQIRVNDF